MIRAHRTLAAVACAGLAALLLGGDAWAAGRAANDVASIQLAGALGTKDEMSSALRVFLVLTGLSLLPAAVICMTSFVRIVVVLSMLRHAIGLPETPPNMVVISLAMFLTLFSMSPVVEKVNAAAVVPYAAGKADLMQAVAAGKAPVRDFMVRQTRESDLSLMVELAGAEPPKDVEDISLAQLVPAFMISELRTAFQIGFVIFLPFLLIDIVVSSALMALGMMMVPPATIAIPVKILLFVLIDGWALVVRSLMGTFA
jgi:flagellar biosynthesis protein FliP